MADAKAYFRSKDFISGVFFIAFGATFFALGRGYAMGTDRNMGPGYFPSMLSVILAIIGVALVVRAAFKPGAQTELPAFGKLAAISAGVVVFGLALRPLGLVPAILALVLISAPVSVKFRWRTALLLAVGLAIGCALLFVKLLGLSIPIFGSLFGG